MNYQQTLDWLFSQLPMYQRIGKSAYKADLKNTNLLMDLLGNPENNFKSVHVAGTNGKGSVSHMLASIFQEAGYKTGLYTSPHLKDFRERIRINGEMITESKVIEFISKHQQKFTDIGLSFFEMTVGMAFDHFSNEEVDIAIIEVGLGGRLDSTNVITPELSIITNISLDHTQFLGNDIKSIAKEKAGIIKPNVAVVVGEKQEESFEVFEQIAALNNAKLHSASSGDHELQTDLKGAYQANNVRTAVTAINLLEKSYGGLQMQLKKGLSNVVKNTGLRGRWEVLSSSPLTICDTAHNIAGVSEIVRQLDSTRFNELHIVWGMVGDKDASAVIQLLPKKAHYHLCQPNIPRGMDVEPLANLFTQHSIADTKIYSSVKAATVSAQKQAKRDDLIFIGGSTFVVAEVL